jgi:hypothetical protein
MSYEVLRHVWLRVLLLGLIITVGVIAAYATLSHVGNHAHAAGDFSQTFTETVGSDVYTFTNTTPAIGDPTSGTATPANLGSWNVTDNGTDLGSFGGTEGVSASGGQETGAVTFSGTGSLSVLNGFKSTGTSFVTPENYKTSSVYQSDIAKGDSVSAVVGPDLMGNSNVVMSCSTRTQCDEIADSPTVVSDLGAGSSTGTIGWSEGDGNITSGYNALQSIAAAPASSTPSQVLARHIGSGPLAIKEQQKPASLTLAVFIIGAVVGVVGGIVSAYCAGRANGCLGLSKGTWAVITAGCLAIGAALTAGAALLPTAGAAAAAGAGEVALGAAEVAAVEAGGAAEAGAALAAAEAADEAVFVSAASSFNLG